MASTASAEPDAFFERPLAVTVHAGLGTPLGFYGVAADLAVRSRLSIEAGVGSGPVGTQVAVNVRARVVRLGTRRLRGEAFSGAVSAAIRGDMHVLVLRVTRGRRAHR